jgi:nucleoside-diphosphate-sugar epimerase
MRTRLAAVTGATGFLGVHLVRALTAAGWTVRVLARRPPSAPGWGPSTPEVVTGDLFDDAALAALVDGADAVVHVAGAIKARDRAGFMSVNRDGTARLAALARRLAPDARFVLISSLAAREPQLSDYAASKSEAEGAARAIMPQDRLTIVRPPAVYGPGDRETLAIFKAAALSPVLPTPSARARLALVHVEDAAAAVVALCAGPSGVFAVADDQPKGYSWREIFAAAALATGRPVRSIDAPPWLLTGLATAAGFIARMNGEIPILTRGKVAELLHPDWTVTPDELAPNRPEPRYGIQAGFTHTLAWYVSEGWIIPPGSAKPPH